MIEVTFTSKYTAHKNTLTICNDDGKYCISTLSFILCSVVDRMIKKMSMYI